jgi:DnaJ-class molecular chaperone
MAKETQGTAQCPRCDGFGVIAKVINWQTSAEPCPRCNENGVIPVSKLTPRERKTWQQRNRREAAAK